MEKQSREPDRAELRSAELPELLQVAAELQARDRAEIERSARERELRDAAEEVGLPAIYLERAAAEITLRRAARRRLGRGNEGAKRAGVGASAALLLVLGAALFLARPPAFAPAPARFLPPTVVEDRFVPLPNPLPATVAPTGHYAPLDLSNQITHSLDQSMLDTPGDDLSALGGGVVALAGIPFRLDGVILVGAPAPGGTAGGEGELPREVDGIPVGRKARRLYFLHATHFSAAPGVRIGAYRVHYQDGTQAEIPIRYGQDVLDWWARPGDAPAPAQSRVVWTGRNAAAAAAGARLRLFIKRWENPHPERIIESLDLVAGAPRPGPNAPDPFLVAFTAE